MAKKTICDICETDIADNKNRYEIDMKVSGKGFPALIYPDVCMDCGRLLVTFFYACRRAKRILRAEEANGR